MGVYKLVAPTLNCCFCRVTFKIFRRLSCHLNTIFLPLLNIKQIDEILEKGVCFHPVAKLEKNYRIPASSSCKTFCQSVAEKATTLCRDPIILRGA